MTDVELERAATQTMGELRRRAPAAEAAFACVVAAKDAANWKTTTIAHPLTYAFDSDPAGFLANAVNVVEQAALAAERAPGATSSAFATSLADSAAIVRRLVPYPDHEDREWTIQPGFAFSGGAVLRIDGREIGDAATREEFNTLTGERAIAFDVAQEAGEPVSPAALKHRDFVEDMRKYGERENCIRAVETRPAPAPEPARPPPRAPPKPLAPTEPSPVVSAPVPVAWSPPPPSPAVIARARRRRIAWLISVSACALATWAVLHAGVFSLSFTHQAAVFAPSAALLCSWLVAGVRDGSLRDWKGHVGHGFMLLFLVFCVAVSVEVISAVAVGFVVHQAGYEFPHRIVRERTDAKSATVSAAEALTAARAKGDERQVETAARRHQNAVEREALVASRAALSNAAVAILGAVILLPVLMMALFFFFPFAPLETTAELSERMRRPT